MDRKIATALIDIVLYMAGMMIYQSNVFGTADVKTLLSKLNVLLDAVSKEKG